MLWLGIDRACEKVMPSTVKHIIKRFEVGRHLAGASWDKVIVLLMETYVYLPDYFKN